MDVSEFVKLTPDAIEILVQGHTPPGSTRPKTRRQDPRWPFRGTVELWAPDADGNETHVLATALNISLNGVAILCDEQLEIGPSMAIAVHLPEATYYGRAIAKHDTDSPVGHIIGMQFDYEG